jgi:hypothetical protein
VLAPLLATLTLLAQLPASPAAPTPTAVVRVPALEAAGVPSHVVDFCQEHLYAELQRQGFAVLRADASADEVLSAEPRAVIVGELVHFPAGFRVTTRARKADTGSVFAEHVVEAVPEQRLLDALTEAVEKLAPQLRAQLAPVVPVATAPAPERPLRRWAWAPAAGGTALLGVGTVFLLQARSKQRELEAPRVTGEPVLDGAAVARSGRRAQTLSRVSYALGGAGVLAGAAMYFLPVERLWGGGEKLQLRVSPGGVGVSGVLP